MPTDRVFVAVRNFSVAGERFKAGEVVPVASLALGVVLRYGDRFVTPQQPPARKRVRRAGPVEPPVAALDQSDQSDQPPDGDVEPEPTGE